MQKIIGIRREDKNDWERRVPLTPEDVRKLKEEHGLSFVVEPSVIRVFKDEEYEEAGAVVSEDLSGCSVVLGVKEMPSSFFEKEKSYVFFSHTIKGQPYNMPMLERLKNRKCNLLDYEKIEDDKGRRLVFFGKYAGLAGMIDGLWMLGKRLEADGHKTGLSRIKQAKDYESLEEARDAIAEAGREFAHNGLPQQLSPMVVGFAGYGHVSQGAQEVFDEIPHHVVEPEDLELLFKNPPEEKPSIWKVVFREEHLVERIKTERPFVLQEYYDHPDRYRGIFPSYLPYLDVLVNCIFWTPAYPKLITKEDAKKATDAGNFRLKAVVDITCDPGGSVECTTHCTDSGNPYYVYDVHKERPQEGITGDGPVILAVDNLPCELPRDSSTSFSRVLRRFVPELMNCDFNVPYDELDLPETLKGALILHEGRFTPPYRYMRKFLNK